ncbi:CHAP domain-containing protein [uncultured Olleya sp.]|uniref:CHAP domain-containing protein n=1 Tax=uncultured Olleya sp. TaxID=757243 RepID=UPI002594EAAD|nr:CHAP domain-containing protein [uncultured Olleya sp.]
MKVTYPTDSLEGKDFDFRSKFGNFLIGDDNTWHGGIHIEEKNSKIKCIADGRIIAYRFEEKYKKVTKNNIKYHYSNCFILVQHDFNLVKHENHEETKPVTFYSLYNHLMPIKEIAKLEMSFPEFMGKETVKIIKEEGFEAKKIKIEGLNARQLQPNGKIFKYNNKTKKSYLTDDTIKFVIPKGELVEICKDDKGKEETLIQGYARVKYDGAEDIYINTSSTFVKKQGGFYKIIYKNDKEEIEDKDSLTEEQKNQKGARVRSSKNFKADNIISIIPKEDEEKLVILEKELIKEKKDGKKIYWYKFKGYENGYTHSSNFKTTVTFDDSNGKKNQIVGCDIPIKKGTHIGYPGLKESKATGKNYTVCHHEIFMIDEEKVNNFLSDDFDIYLNTEKPKEKNKYYLLDEGVEIEKAIKGPDDLKFAKKTPVIVKEKNTYFNFCKVIIPKEVKRTVQKSALVENLQKNNDKQTVYDIKKASTEYMNKIFDNILPQGANLHHIDDVENSLVSVKYIVEDKTITEKDFFNTEFWIPLSDLSENYEFKTERKKTQVYKSVQNSRSILENLQDAKTEPQEFEFPGSLFNQRFNTNNTENKPKEVGRKNITKKTYNSRIKKDLLGYVPFELLKNTTKYISSGNSTVKKGGKITGHYPISPTTNPNFNDINTAFNGKLSSTETSHLFYTYPGLNCGKNGVAGNDHRRLTVVYEETSVKDIIPKIIKEDDKEIQAIIPVDIYKIFEIDSRTSKVYVNNNTKEDSKEREDTDTLFAFFENKLPNVSGFPLRKVKACDADGNDESWKTASHRLLAFDIEAFNKSQEAQYHNEDGAHEVNVGDEVGLIKEVTNIWLSSKKDNEDFNFKTQKPTLVKLTGKEIKLYEENDDFHYLQVETVNMYLSNDTLTIQKGWIKSKDFTKKFFSPYHWKNFGFEVLDAGSEYIYKVKNAQNDEDKKSEFLKKIWEKFNIDQNNVIEATEVNAALNTNETRYEMSRIVAKHKSEWALTEAEIKPEVEKFYKDQINYIKNKNKNTNVDDLLSQKQKYLENLKTQITDLKFWNEAKNAPVSINDNSESENNKPLRVFPDANEILHFHPLAFINQMKLMFEGVTGECFCNKDFTTEDLKRIVQYVRYNTFYNKKSITEHHEDRLFHGGGGVPESDRTYERLTEVLNSSFTKFGITKCSHKIHYLANMYTETNYFTATEEFGNNHGYMPYKGRGFQQVTDWNHGKAATQAERERTSNYKAYSDAEGNQDIYSGTNYLKVASDIALAADTAGWFWKRANINAEAEKDDIFGTAKKINNPSARSTSAVNGYSERRAAWIKFKEAFNNYPYNCVTDASKNQREYGEGVLEEMREWADTHVQYKQEGEWAGTRRTGLRTTETKDALGRMDCSEFVCRYLHKLGVLPTMKAITTSGMVTEEKFRQKLGNDNIEKVTGDTPQAGDIFVWSRSNNDGHTGIVHSVDGNNITILEAIGKGGSADENHNRNNGGYEGYNCTRTSVYQKTGGALLSHGGWKGYYRPKNYTKQL